MTVSSQTNKIRIVGNGVASAFPLPFRFFANSEVSALFVERATGVTTPASIGADYTLTGAGEPEVNGSATGVLTTTVPLASTHDLIILRSLPTIQATDIVNQGEFFASTHEDVFDRLTMIAQQQQEELSRAVKTSVSDTITPDQLLDSIRQSEQNAVAAAASASSSAASAAQSFDDFDDRYLGSKNSDPTTNNDGDPLQNGSLYWNAISSKMRVFSGSAWYDFGQSLSAIYASEFGLIGDGSDETAKVQAAVTSASAQRKVLIGDRTKTYKVTSTITGASNCYIKDFNIDASAMTGTKHALVFQGAFGSNSALTADVAANAFTIPVTDGSIFAADEWVLLTVDTSYYPYSTYNVARGEWVQVRSISGNTVNFTTPLVQGYTTAAGATLRKCSFVENVVLDNVRITGSGVPNSNERGACFRFARDFQVRNCDFINLDQYACELSMCIKFCVHHNQFRGTFYDGVTGTIFYAIVLLDACQYFTVHDNHGSRSRHLVVTTAASAGQGRWGQCMFGIIHDNVVEDCMAGGAGRSFAYEMHGTGQHLLWANNIANGCYSFMRIEGGSDSQVIGGGCNGYAYQGIIIGGSGQTVQRIDIRGVKISNYTGELGGLIAGVRFETTSVLEHVTVDGVVVDSAAKSNVGNAISIGTSTTCRNNVVKNLRANAGDVEATTVAVLLANGVTGFTFENCDLFGWRLGYSLTTASKIVVRGGTVENFTPTASGFGFYSNGDRNVCKDVHFRNINTAIRLDTASTNNLAVNNTLTDCSVTTPSNSGTGNTVTPNYTV